MPSFGRTSTQRLATCDPRLQEICHKAIKIMDFSVICGHRGKEAQDKAYRTGKSKAQYPNSQHNKAPSLAMDLAPWPIDWNDRERFARLAGIIETIAFTKNIKLKWGGDFKSISDMPHFEIKL